MIGDFLGIGQAICKLLILMVAGIFKLVSGAYQIFLVLSKTNIFEQDTYAHLTDKVYIILAVTMLFVVAYTFITMIIDPDKNKGGKAVEDLIKKSVTSLILIVLCPTLFTFAFDLQDAIMDQDIIGKFFTTEGEEKEATKSIKQGGNLMAGTTFAAFFYPAFETTDVSQIENRSEGKHLKSGEYEIDCSSEGSCTLEEAIDYACNTGTFSVFTAFALNWLEGEEQDSSIDFNMLLALIAGFYLVYVIISFCFDLAIRVIKLAFYQIIAPICIACRMLPNKESIFKNWWKAVCKTYLSIFIRVFIMNLAVFLMVELTKADFWSNICNSEEMECGGVIKFLAFAFLILGLVTFIKQAAKLIDEIFGLGDVKLGITDKLKEGGGFAGIAMGRAAYRGTTAGFKNGIPGKEKWKNMNFGQRVGAVAKATARGAAVGATSMARSAATSTGGLWTDKFRQEMSKTGTNAKVAAQQSEVGMEKLEHMPDTLKALWSDFKTLRGFKRSNKELENEIEDLNKQLEQHTRNGDLQAAIKLKAQIEEAEKAIHDKEKAKTDYIKQIQDAKTAKEAEIRKAEKHRDDLIVAGASAATIRAAEDDIRRKTEEYARIMEDPDELRRLDDAINDAVSKKNSKQSEYQEFSRKYADKYHATIDEHEAQFIEEEKQINKLIEEKTAQIESSKKEINKLELTNLVENIKDNINKYCFQNPNGVLQILDERLDGITKKIEKVSSKYNHAISVNFESAMGKNTLFKSLSDDQKRALLEDEHFKLGEATVQSIESLSNNLKRATTFAQVEEQLGTDLCTKLGITKDNFTTYQQAFIDTIDNPFHKDVIKATSDAINHVDNKNIIIKPSQVSVVLNDRDSEDARTEEFAYQVAYEAIYGKDTAGTVRSYDGKKGIQDNLRDASVSGQRHDIRKKVQNQIFSVNTEDKGKK